VVAVLGEHGRGGERCAPPGRHRRVTAPFEAIPRWCSMRFDRFAARVESKFIDM
jgi:hypothetical protein